MTIKKLTDMKKQTFIRLMMVVTALCCSLLHTSYSKANAQCDIENTAFDNGEFLAYDLYFNWQFVWVKVGSATMSTVKSKHSGQDAYRTSLITRGNSKLDKFFVMRDTLLSYCDMNLNPLYHRKGALEGDRYYVDELWYKYPNGNCQLRMHRIDADGEEHWQTKTYKDCVYDMMSIFLRARNFDAAQMKEGDVIPMPITDAKHLSNSWLKYRGKETYKIDGTKEKFRCLVFSFIEHEDNENKELIRFYVTDDPNHLPVRLDLFLSFGSAKVFLKTYKGIRNPLTSKQ
jgi:hypothetical protein